MQTPSEQAQVRLRLALRAAAAADEKLKDHSMSSPSQQSSPLSRRDFADAVASIESDAFAPSSFKSSRLSKVAVKVRVFLWVFWGGGDPGQLADLPTLPFSAEFLPLDCTSFRYSAHSKIIPLKKTKAKKNKKHFVFVFCFCCFGLLNCENACG